MSEFKRDMDEIWIEIEKATEDIDVPDSLLPDNIVKELRQNAKKEERRRMRRITQMAAAVAVVVATAHILTASKSEHICTPFVYFVLNTLL